MGNFRVSLILLQARACLLPLLRHRSGNLVRSGPFPQPSLVALVTTHERIPHLLVHYISQCSGFALRPDFPSVYPLMAAPHRLVGAETKNEYARYLQWHRRKLFVAWKLVGLGQDNRKFLFVPAEDHCSQPRRVCS